MSPRCWQDKLTLKTYPLGPDDPNPPLQRQGGSWAIYPYTMQDDLLEGPPEEREYTALHLENEYLHCIVLPELGGRVHSLFDKVTRREVFYRNHVVKYGLVAVRGAWISGGIEFNFPTGHTYTTVSPVSWEMAQDPKTAWLAVGNICRLSRMEWWVKLSLIEGERVLHEEVFLHNRMPYKQRYWFWNNAAVPATDDLHLVYPARKARVAGRIVDYPVTADGWDGSWYRNHRHADDIFTLDVRENFFGCHYADSDFGMVNVASHMDVQGRKFFTWGTADDGMIWVDLLTDHDGQYVEIQSGRFETQSIWGFLKPNETVHWEEHWFPVHGMGGWVHANEFGALNFEIKDDCIRMGATVVTKIDEGWLALQANGEEVWSSELTLTPEEPFVTEIPMPEGCSSDTEFKLALWESQGVRLGQYFAGLQLVSYVHPPERARQPKVAETGEDIEPAAKTEDECTAEELCVRATDALRTLSHAEARRLAEKALTLDPGLSDAHTILGLLDCRSGLYSAAREHLEAAVQRDRENAEAWHLLGLARWKCGDHESAGLALREARRREGMLGAADRLLLQVVAEEKAKEAVMPWDTDPGSWVPAHFGLRAFTHQKLDRPANAAMRFIHWARGDVQNWLEQAFFGSPPWGVQMLEEAINHCPGAQDYPMTHYALAYWQHKMGQHDKALPSLERARQCPPDYCFPSRLEELDILQWAVAQQPDDWKARYYLGNLLASLDRTAEAMEQWRAAAGPNGGSSGVSDAAGASAAPTFAVLYRNLGFGALRWENNPQEAVEYYRRAIGYNPYDYRYYLDLAAIYATCPGTWYHNAAASQATDSLSAEGKHKSTQTEAAAAQLDLFLSAPPEVQQKWQIAARMAEVLSQLGRHEEALIILRAHRFFPWEGARGMRDVYVNCLLALGGQATADGDHDTALLCYEAAMEYPRNLGVGKTWRPQDARIYWLAALEADALGDEAKRQEYLTVAAQEPHGGPCEADWWKLLALRELGRMEEAVELECQLRQWAEDLLKDEKSAAQGQEMLERLRSLAQGAR